jgi:hypothetical protein
MGNHAGSQANGESSLVGYSIYRSWMVAAANCGRVGDQSRNGAQVSAPGIPGHFDRPTLRRERIENQSFRLPALGCPPGFAQKGLEAIATSIQS